MPDTTSATAKLTRFYSELSPSLETVKQALTFAGVDTGEGVVDPLAVAAGLGQPGLPQGLEVG